MSVTGTRGPVPKRSDQRRRRNKEGGEITRSPSASRAPVDSPPALEEWHQLAADWYNSLAQSGQSAFYEASDWAQARVWAELLSRQMNAGAKVSAQMILAWSAGATELLTTEGSRRRTRLELERAGATDDDEDAAVVAIDDYQKRLAR